MCNKSQYDRSNKGRINYKLDVAALNVIGWYRQMSLGNNDERYDKYMDIFIVFKAKLYICFLVYMDKSVWTLNQA
jgi:hypothetical protein